MCLNENSALFLLHTLPKGSCILEGSKVFEKIRNAQVLIISEIMHLPRE